jgi:predicted DNA-binding transcriptional regulator AlpA
MDKPTRISIAELEQRLGRDRTTVARWIKARTFPRPHYLGTRRSWWLQEVEQWERQEMARPPSSRRSNLPGCTIAEVDP